ncbi:MFS transporter [Sphingomonas sp. ID1715]|uniref:MFS transporter n=1 Tax=Sphingomonas sp. ID1715 TaxID=1656898 RepID=UPI001489D131|nr:MFS transporter [Sphingomonas sp. ID1715]NNM76476.1 MFS transporter [Sphingomonas sp. ID1715]
MATAALAAPPARMLSPATVGLIGFLTLVDLFATQAILPSLARLYQVTPAAIGLAANASTLGMAIAGLVAGVLGRHVDRRQGVWISLVLLAVPTALLAFAPNLTVFAVLRVVQGLCMATAFTLTLTYLSERCSATGATTALAAYVTGGVASNLIGRLTAATVAGLLGPAISFLFFAALNLGGAALVARALSRGAPMRMDEGAGRRFWSGWAEHLRNPRLLRLYLIGFLILFGFIGTFSYVGFVLARPPLSLSMTALGLVFLVFAPSMVTTPLAGAAATRVGLGPALALSLLLAIAGLPLLLATWLPALLAGLALVGIGTFFAQAVATGQVGRTAERDRAAASGLYLSFYYCGGLAGAAVVGQVFDRFGWTAALESVGAALALATLLGFGVRR